MRRRILSGIIGIIIIFALIAGWYMGLFFIYNPSKDDKDLDLSKNNNPNISGEGFSIQPDIRLFTVYAFLNSVGEYNNELDKEMTPEREELKKDIQERIALIPKNKVDSWRKYYKQHKSHPYGYLYYSLTLGNPPDFNYIVDRKNIDKDDYQTVRFLRGFKNILADFYTEAKIQQLYDGKYKEIMYKYCQAYNKNEISQNIKSVYDYLRLPESMAENIHVCITPTPFESHYCAYSLNYGSTIYIIDGPGSNGSGLNVHEYLHKLVNPVAVKNINGNDGELKKSFDDNKSTSMIKKNYGNIDTYICECMVRAIDHRIELKLNNSSNEAEKRIQSTNGREGSSGLGLVPYFYDKLKEYEANPSITFDDFVVKAFKEYSYKKN